jgi:hypothetical protein
VAGERVFLGDRAGGGWRADQRSFEVAYLEDGAEQRLGLADAAGLAFETAAPIRDFPSYKGQRNNPGLWWSSTMQGHVGHESWLERDHLMLLDFDPTVTGIASQPFWLFWDDDGKQRSHAPDYFVRTTGGQGAVIDCRLAKQIKPRDQVTFEVTAEACEQVGWSYRLLDAPADPVLVNNVRWLAGYRQPRHHRMDTATRLVEVFAKTRPLLEGVEHVGDPIAVLPVAYNLMWNHVLECDLSVPLHEHSDVVCIGGDR